ncbi:hypothetical protein ACFL34_03005 [Candidatus Sumerlaeota bacterium]
MKKGLQNLILNILALIARIAAPAVARQLQRLSMRIVSNVPKLGSTWVAHFRDPELPYGSREKKVDVSLQQFGRFVRGTGHIQGEPDRPFEYRGIIKRNAFYGNFMRDDPHVLASTGTFVLKINADSCRMLGSCTWYEGVLDEVWSSVYVWVRK